MATAILRPTSTDANGWFGGTHADVDEEVSDPDMGDENELYSSNAQGDDNDEVILGFGTIQNVAEVTNIRVKTLGGIMGTNTPEVDVNMGGWQNLGAEPECPITGGPLAEDYTWEDNDFPGSFSQSDLDDLQVKYIADVPVKLDGNGIDVMYVIVTYTEAAVGYGHDFLGIPAANIDSIMGIPAANIDNICGL